MTPQELRMKLEEGGVSKDIPYERVLNILIECMMRCEDPPTDASYDTEEEEGFVLGFCVGAASMGIFMEDVNRRFFQ